MDRNKRKIADQVLSWSEDDFAELIRLYDKNHKTEHKKALSKLCKAADFLLQRVKFRDGKELSQRDFKAIA